MGDPRDRTSQLASFLPLRIRMRTLALFGRFGHAIKPLGSGVDTLTPLAYSLASQNIETGATIRPNFGTSALVEASLAAKEGALSKHGALVVETGQHTGRSANDKFIVRDAETEDTVWWGKVNKGMTPEHFANLKADFMAALKDKDTLYVADLFGGSQPEHRVNVRVINELAWHNLFIRTLLVRPTVEELADFAPEYTIMPEGAIDGSQ